MAGVGGEKEVNNLDVFGVDNSYDTLDQHAAINIETPLE